MDMILSSQPRGHVIVHQARASDKNFMRLPWHRQGTGPPRAHEWVLRSRRVTKSEKLGFVLIVSAMVAALAVHQFIGETTQTLARSTGVHVFTPDEFGVGSD